MKRLIFLAIVAAPLGFGHDGESLKPHDLWFAWSFDPGTVIPLVLTAVLYFRGAKTFRGVSSRQRIYFWAGWFLLCVALLSPLHPLGEALFSAHMAQHGAAGWSPWLLPFWSLHGPWSRCSGACPLCGGAGSGNGRSGQLFYEPGVSWPIP